LNSKPDASNASLVKLIVPAQGRRTTADCSSPSIDQESSGLSTLSVICARREAQELPEGTLISLRSHPQRIVHHSIITLGLPLACFSPFCMAGAPIRSLCTCNLRANLYHNSVWATFRQLWATRSPVVAIAMRPGRTKRTRSFQPDGASSAC
jgi:hypothetical protein